MRFFSIIILCSCITVLYAQESTVASAVQEQVSSASAESTPVVAAAQEQQQTPQPMPVQAPQLPEPPQLRQPEEVVAEKAQDVDVDAIDVEKGVGFDTLGLEQPEGNWLVKRIWWEKAEVRYEKIKNLMDQILDARMAFFAQRNEVENKILDPFYIQNSLTQGQLEEIVIFLLDELKRERERDKSLSSQERQLYETLLAEQRSLEQLSLDVEAIRKLDIALDDALTRLMEQINVCRNHEKQAWNAFKEIAKVLDHNKARALYYTMDTYFSNIKTVNNYLQNAFAQHFNSIINTIKQSVERIKTTMATLKEKGLDLRQQVRQLEEQDLALEKKEEPKPVEKKKPVEEEPEEEPQSFFGGLLTTITDYASMFWDFITSWWK